MKSSDLPKNFLDTFRAPGSTAQITNMGVPEVEPEDRFVVEGEIEELRIDGEMLVIKFAWLGRKNLEDSQWYLVEDPEELDYTISLDLFLMGMSPGEGREEGRYVLLPLAPISLEQVLFVAASYVGQTGRVPLSRDKVLPATTSE